jgi:hypothetical protein
VAFADIKASFCAHFFFFKHSLFQQSLQPNQIKMSNMMRVCVTNCDTPIGAAVLREMCEGPIHDFDDV